MIDRKYFKQIENELETKQITALVGARQVGKTTILDYVYQKVKDKAIFLSLDEIDILNLLENDLNLFIEQYVIPYDYIFIDEIQYSKIGGKALKLIYDKYKKKVFISGSSSPEMSINSLQYLVGRVNIIEIFSISFEEYISYVSPEKKIILSKIRTQSQLEQFRVEMDNFLKYGSYPEIITTNKIDKKEEKLKNLVNTYFFKEIRDILNFSNLFDYKKLLQRLALTDGNIVNKNSISAEINIDNKKINNIIDVFNNTYVINILRPYHNNKVKELIKTPKIYMQDLGLKNSLIQNFNSLDLKQDKGQVYENFLLSLFVKEGLDIRFWNFKNKFEIDFVLEKDNKLIGFECKSKLKSDNISRSIKKFVETANVSKVYVFNENIDSKRELDGVEIIFTNYLNIIPIIKSLK